MKTEYKVTLKTNTESTITFDKDVTKVEIKNPTQNSIFIKADERVMVDGGIEVAAGTTLIQKFASCSVLHLISEGAGEVKVDVLSILKSPQRATLTPNAEKIFNFNTGVDKFSISNFGPGVIYFAIDTEATINGDNTYKLEDGIGANKKEKCYTIHVISSLASEVEVSGEIDEEGVI